jgi:hypothetical protein
MRHHLDIPLATDTAQQVLELRRLRGELGTQALDSSNQTLYALPSAIVQRERYVAAVDAAVPEDAAPDEIVPLWHFRGRQGRQG